MNNDLISRSALLERFENAQSNVGSLVETVFFDGVMAMVDTAPAVDAVEVVRCKNCKHYENGVCRHITYIMDGYYRNTFEVKSPDDFCSIGERLDAEVSE